MIDKKTHPAVHRLVEAREGKGRPAALFVEGARLVEELLSSGLRPTEFYFSAALRKPGPLLARLEEAGARGDLLSPTVMEFVSDLEAPPGIVVLAPRPPDRWEEAIRAADMPLVVVLDGAQSPSNAGAVVRAAEAAGATAVLQSTGGADLLGPKALRSSSGSAFRLPLGGGRSGPEWAEKLSAMGLEGVAADAGEGTVHTSFDWTRPTALFLGGETGFSNEALRALPKVRIPLRPPVESLNVAVAAGVLLFEANRRKIGLANDSGRT
jgi:TrmH family RNA methyltransferase